MHFERAGRSAVRSVRQRELLNGWHRVARHERALPLMHQYLPEHLEEERPDLMYYDVRREGDGIRFVILQSGANLLRAFNTATGEGQYLEDILDAERLKYITPPLLASIKNRRPVYTISEVSDVNGVPVSYERLVLPFGANDHVQQLIVSLKTISIEGRFEMGKLIRSRQGLVPSYAAIIERDSEPASARIAVANDVVEI